MSSSIRRLVQWPLQRGLKAMSRANYALVRGMHPTDRISTERFLTWRHWSVATDYVRNGTLELLCRELTNVPGSIAELGVYRGDFALLMHINLPDRPIHLFDTFDGFEKKDRMHDESRSMVTMFHDFSYTSASKVRALFSETVDLHIHEGWFPATADEVSDDERFALVNLDADLYMPMIAGLNFFWPRMTPGGYILVHDYNNGGYSGTKQAVQEFVAQTRATFCPIPDWGGTAVFRKPQPEPVPEPVHVYRSDDPWVDLPKPVVKWPEIRGW